MSSQKISVIIPIYNVEKYLRSTIESVIAQDVGFHENIRIILVNDGSPDDSALICEEYSQKYPQNITYVLQENGGVSAARNNGLKLADTEYVHFLDSDDIISTNAYSVAINLLDSNKDTDVAALRVEFFDGQLGEHPLNYKFTSDRVVDIEKEPNSPVLHVSSCLIRRTSIKHNFDSTIKISEDMKFLTELLMNSPKYIVVSTATYYYRKRSEGGSAIDGSLKNRDFYLVTPIKVYQYLLSSWTVGAGKPHPYVQYVVAYDLQWRIRQELQTVLSKTEQDSYKKTIYDIIKCIDESVFFEQQFLSISQLAYIMSVQQGKLSEKTISKLMQLVEDTRIPVRIDFIESVEGGLVRVEGWRPNGSDMHQLSVSLNGISYPVTRIENIYRQKSFLGDVLYSGGAFYIELPSEALGSIEFFDQTGKRVGVVTKRQSGIPDKKYGYRVYGDRIYINKDESIKIVHNTAFSIVILELRWILRMLVALRLRRSAKKLVMVMRSSIKSELSPSNIVEPLLDPIRLLIVNIKSISMRAVYFLLRPLMKKPIWIVSDRLTAAGDNGEALFAYLKEENVNDVSIYFAIEKHSKDYIRLRQEYGNSIISSSSLWYRLLFLLSSKIISSHADDVVINPFGNNVEVFYDLFRFDFVFLQHGIIRNDLSAWLNRYNKNIRLFITSTEQEYQSILEYKYYYSPSKVLLSGLARYDLLESDPRNKLILAPTWRHNLARPLDITTGKRQYDEEFRNSDYFNFYNQLMNDNRIKQALKSAGMKGEFYMHPAFEEQLKDFSSNESFTIKSFPYDYRTAFREGSLLVTDYSSVLFDFVFLKKPIVYSQFDEDEFYANQTIYVKGYMNDDTDGFGPVAKNLDDTIDAIVKYIHSGCKMEKKYVNRVDGFFKWHDRNNRQRIYHAIRELHE